jgi:circadian clock protein KaiC
MSIIPTGIPGFDEMLDGGISENSLILISGGPGTGKTILSLQWLFAGAKAQQRGMYLCLDQNLSQFIRNLQTLGFYDEKLAIDEMVQLNSLEGILTGMGVDVSNRQVSESGILGAIEQLIVQHDLRRVVLDSITGLRYIYDDDKSFRKFILELSKKIEQTGATLLLTNEDHMIQNSIEEFAADGVIELTNIPGEQKYIRRITIKKLRGQNYRSGSAVFEITGNGIIVYSKIPSHMDSLPTLFTSRIKSGSEKLDDMLEGGVPVGHVIILAGNTGTGKTTLGLQFLEQGVKDGEHVLAVSIEESVQQFFKTSEKYGWDLKGQVENGQASIIRPDLLDLNPNRTLHEMMNIMKEKQVKRLFFDSVSSLESAQNNKDSVREFLIQLSMLVKSMGATVFLTYLLDNQNNTSGDNLLLGGKSNELRLSSIADGLIILKYTEEDKQVVKYINVLKMRGTNHDRTIRKYEITDSGIDIER